MGIKDRMKPLTITKKEDVGYPGLSIFTLTPPDSTDITPFEPGQYMTIGDDVAQPAGIKFVPRPYSVASSPLERGRIEFYIVEVDNGEFTPHLFRKKIGETLWYMGPKGKFMLSRTTLTHLAFICTGTGLAPFISMLRSLKIAGKSRPFTITLMHGNRTSLELGYREELRAYESDPDFDFVYIPTVSRPDGDKSWNNTIGAGRVNDTLRLILGLPKQGKVDPTLPAHQDTAACLARLPQNKTAFFMCGNPEMIVDGKNALAEKSWSTPDNIFTEDYW